MNDFIKWNVKLTVKRSVIRAQNDSSDQSEWSITVLCFLFLLCGVSRFEVNQTGRCVDRLTLWCCAPISYERTHTETGVVCVCEISGLRTGGSAGQRRSVCCVSVGGSLFSSLSSVGGFGRRGERRGSGMSSFPACTAALRVTSVWRMLSVQRRDDIFTDTLTLH